MPAAKRNNLAPAASPTKKPKKNSLAFKCGVIEAAIQRAEVNGLTTTAATALVAAVPFSLGQAKEERHKFQEEAVDMTGKILELYRASLEEGLKLRRSDIVQAEKRRDDLQAVALQRQSGLDDAQGAAGGFKMALAGVARTFQAAKAAVKEAERLAEEGGQELKAAACQKHEVETLQQEMDHLHEDGGSRINDFVKRLKPHVDSDSSMLTAIPCVFAKDPSSRGQFDLMVALQLTEKVQKSIAKLQATIEGGAAAEAQRAASVEATKATLLQARQKQIEAARTFTEASDAAKKADEAVRKMRSEIAQAKKALKEATQKETEAQIDLELYSQEVLETFAELRDHTAMAEDDAAPTPAHKASPNAAGGSPSLATVPAVVEVAA